MKLLPQRFEEFLLALFSCNFIRIVFAHMLFKVGAVDEVFLLSSFSSNLDIVYSLKREKKGKLLLSERANSRTAADKTVRKVS